MIMEAKLDGTNPQPISSGAAFGGFSPGYMALGGQASPGITTAPETTGTGAAGSTTVKDTATLSGGSNPTGTITFTLYGPSSQANCSGTAADSETANVAGNSTYATPTGFIPSQAGTYWWTASYSGDTNNNPAVSNCGDESVTVTTPVIHVATDGSDSTGTGSQAQPATRRSRPR